MRCWGVREGSGLGVVFATRAGEAVSFFAEAPVSVSVSRVARAHLELHVVGASRRKTSRGEGEVLGHRAWELDGDGVRVSRVRGGVRPRGRGSSVAGVPTRDARGSPRVGVGEVHDPGRDAVVNGSVNGAVWEESGYASPS